MKKMIKVLLVVGLAVLLSQCATGPVGGALFTSVTYAGEVNPANDVPAEKTGEGCNRNLLMIASWGNAGAGDVAHENGIKRIASIDHSHLNVLYLYRNYCTIVRGK